MVMITAMMMIAYMTTMATMMSTETFAEKVLDTIKLIFGPDESSDEEGQSPLNSFRTARGYR